METGALQNLFNQNQPQQIKTALFRPGQILNGKILKLFPDQIAELQIGSQKIIAQLEAPLSANERYWFQVQPGEGKVHLKVIAAGADAGKQSDSLARILGEFSMSTAKENIELVRFFIKEQLPVSKEILQQAAEWLKTAQPRGAGLEAVKMILARGLPLSTATYSALYTANKEQSLILLMDNLLTALNESPETGTSMEVKNMLNELMNFKKADASRQALGLLFSSWLTDQRSEGAAAFKILQQIGAIPPHADEKAILQQLHSALQGTKADSGELPVEWDSARKLIGMIDKGTIAEAVQLIRSLAAEGTPATLSSTVSRDGFAHLEKSLIDLLSVTGKDMNKQDSLLVFKQLLALVFSRAADQTSLEKGMAVLLGSKGNFISAGKQLEQVAGTGTGPLHQMPGSNSQQAELLAKILIQAEQAAVSSADNAPMLSSAKIKEFLSGLGLSYEHQLAEAFKDPLGDRAGHSDTLKPSLLRLLNEQPPQAVKEAAELLLNKITGFQVLSQETGPLQQLIAQLPFFLGDKMAEVTIQWSGQKKKDGSIDPDFCRVMFYLNLENIDDTIIDMQVQNRIMSINVINENPSLKKLSGQLMPLLKDRLAKMDYHLSSVSFLSPDSSKTEGQSKKLADLYSKKEYNGVDIKI